jgi:hypothetical protein
LINQFGKIFDRFRRLLFRQGLAHVVHGFGELFERFPELWLNVG